MVPAGGPVSPALVLIGAAQAAPVLAPGGWLVDGDQWSQPTARVDLGAGHAFAIQDDDQIVGWIHVGTATLHVEDAAPHSLLAATVARELGDAASGRRWTLPATAVIARGAAHRPGRHWRPVNDQDGVLHDISEASDPQPLGDAAAHREARATAAALVAARHAAAAAQGRRPVPTGPGWGQLEIQTTRALGALAGNGAAADERWLVAVARDPLLPPGVAAATLVFGDRWVDPLTGA